MAENRVTRFRITPEREAEIRAQVDWSRVENMTEEEIAAGIAADPDAAHDEMTDAQIRGARVRAIRSKLGLSQAQFADRFRFSKRTLEQWEQGRREPDATAWAYLLVIEHEPNAVDRALVAAG